MWLTVWRHVTYNSMGTCDYGDMWLILWGHVTHNMETCDSQYGDMWLVVWRHVTRSRRHECHVIALRLTYSRTTSQNRMLLSVNKKLSALFLNFQGRSANPTIAIMFAQMTLGKECRLKEHGHLWDKSQNCIISMSNNQIWPDWCTDIPTTCVLPRSQVQFKFEKCLCINHKWSGGCGW